MKPKKIGHGSESSYIKCRYTVIQLQPFPPKVTIYGYSKLDAMFTFSTEL